MNIEVIGRHALMFDDDSMAAFVNSGDALVEWNSLQIDRYDVRHLLPGPIPPRRRRSHQPTGDSSLNSELDHERYLDLHSEEPAEVQEEVQEAEKSGDGSFRAVGFSYGDADYSADQRNAEEGLECPRFQPPFSVPESIVHSLPPTEKVHQIIARTATFVSQHGAQSEIVLRVKQGDNPTFGFLMPHHNLHPYFRFLVDHQEVLQSGANVNSQSRDVSADQKKMDAGGALSLLGSVYGTEDDDDSVLEDAQEFQDAASGDMSRNSSLDLHVAEKTGSNTHALPKNKVVAKSPLHNKDRPPAVKKNPSIIASKVGRTGSLKEGDVSGPCPASKENNDKPLILEPPADIKILVDKIVDFITNNGKQFETALREQDSKQGRFPFLVPSDQYHPYYLKVFQKSEQSKQGVKNSSGNLVRLGLDKKVSSYKEDHGGSSLYSDLPNESDRKEKFKMSIGKSVKDTQDQQSKTTQHEGGITIDDEAAAAIFEAATRCFKNPYGGINSSSSLKEIQHGGDVRQDPGQKSSSSDTKAIAKPDVSETSSYPESDSILTKEQRLKAERLKRAKMFVAKLKSGTSPSKDEPLRSLSVEPLGPGTSVLPAEVNHDSTIGGSNPTLAEISPSEKRENSERKLLREENTEKRSRRKYRSKSDMHEDSDGEEVSRDRDERGKDVEEKNHRHSRKKHRSRHSSEYDRDYKKKSHSHSHGHSRKRHRSRGSSCEADDGETSSDSSAHRHSSKKKHSSHRHHRHYEDDDRKSEKHSRKRKHRSHRSSRSSKESPNKIEAHSSGDEASQHGHYEEKKRSASEKRADLEEGEVSPKVSDPSKSTNGRASSQPSETTPQISDDLRAKIRAMLLSTMG